LLPRPQIRDRSYENQRHRASGLNLLVAAIISFYGIQPTCSALSITYATKATIRHPVIWFICRHCQPVKPVNSNVKTHPKISLSPTLKSDIHAEPVHEKITV
jgi:hypothetical protein